MKKLIAVLLTLVLIFSALPFSVFSATIGGITVTVPKENTHPITVNFTYEQTEYGKITITGYDSVSEDFDGTLYIPNNYKYCVVSAISDSAFKDN